MGSIPSKRSPEHEDGRQNQRPIFLADLTALEKVKFVMKAGRPVDRNTL
jgi:hypothetical protein